MTPAALLHALRARGVSLWVEQDALRYRAPRGVLTAELQAAMFDARREIAALLQTPVGKLQPETWIVYPEPEQGRADLEALFSRMRAQGIEISPLLDGLLAVHAHSPLPDDVRAELRSCARAVHAFLGGLPS